MNLKKITRFYFILFPIILWPPKTCATERQAVLEEAKQALLIPPDGKGNKKNAEQKKLQQIKTIVKADLKNGLPDAAVDIYLFVQGLLEDDLLSLQALLALNNSQNFPSDLSGLITYPIAQKLAYALKENRIAVKTEVTVKIKQGQEGCNLRINGVPYSSHALTYPAGVPLYAALYCPDGTFDVQLVRPMEGQTRMTLQFQTHGIQENGSTPSPTKSKIQAAKTNSAISTGIGIDLSFGETKSQRVHNVSLKDGLFLFSHTELKIKNFLVTLDLARVTRTRPTTEADTQQKTSEVSESAFLSRPSVGLNIPLHQFSQIFSANAALFLTGAFLRGPSSDHDLSGMGFTSRIGLTFHPTRHTVLETNVTAGTLWGTLGSANIGLQTHLGIEFD